MKSRMFNIICLLCTMVNSVLMCACSDNQVETTIPEISISVGDEEISSLCFEGYASSNMVAIRSTGDFELSVDADWCQLSNSGGSATLTDYQTVWLKISVGKNESDYSRTAILTAQTGSVTKRITINQKGTAEKDEYGFEVAKVALHSMGNGLNIGNTLDSYGDWITGGEPKDYETAWGNPQISPALISTYKQAGFKALRLPVTWRGHIDEEGNITDGAWLKRVREVVDYIINQDMYCIINVHHDSGGDNGAWLRADQDDERLTVISKKFVNLWTSIANEFASYGDKLIFEGYNEMLDGNLTWSNTDEKGYASLNQLAQDFVSAVRSTGGANAHRNLIVNTYGADCGNMSVSNFRLPKDTVSNHLMVEVHIYSDTTAQLDAYFEALENHFTSKGIPVIIGEFGKNGETPEDEQVEYVEYFLSKASRLHVPAFHWFDIIDRNSLEWTLPKVKETILKYN